MKKFFNIEPINNAYTKLIDEDYVKKNGLDIIKICDYIKRGADINLTNKQKHTLLDVLQKEYSKKLKEVLEDQEIGPIEGEFLNDLSTNIDRLVAVGYKVSYQESKTCIKFINFLMEIDTIPKLKEKNHLAVMNIIDKLNSNTEFSISQPHTVV